MVNSLDSYKKLQNYSYSTEEGISKVNEYYLEIRKVLDKIYEISESDIYASYELYNKLSYELKLEFIRLYGDIYGWYKTYSKRYDEDLKMIKKHDPERARYISERILKKEI